MAAFLSEDWQAEPSDPVAEALAASSTEAELKVGRIITGGPDGEVRFTALISGGSVTYEPGVDDSAEVTLTDTFANAQAQLSGELAPNAAFMRGQTKVTGPTSLLLDLMAASRTGAYEAARSQLAARSAG